MEHKKTILFIEGEPNSPNGDLRQGFAKLLEKKVGGKLPKIIFGAGKTQTIDKFLNNRLNADSFLLLVDLDGPENTRDSDLSKYKLTNRSSDVFYMIQEMEAWFISQPDILDDFYGKDNNGKKVSEKLTKREIGEIDDPKGELKKATKTSQKGVYQEISHGVELLKRLDTDRLCNAFIDVKNLIERLKQ